MCTTPKQKCMRNHFSLSALDGPWYLLQKHVLQYVVFCFWFFWLFFSTCFPFGAGTCWHTCTQHYSTLYSHGKSPCPSWSDMMSTTFVLCFPAHHMHGQKALQRMHGRFSHEWKACMSAPNCPLHIVDTHACSFIVQIVSYLWFKIAKHQAWRWIHKACRATKKRQHTWFGLLPRQHVTGKFIRQSMHTHILHVSFLSPPAHATLSKIGCFCSC